MGEYCKPSEAVDLKVKLDGLCSGVKRDAFAFDLSLVRCECDKWTNYTLYDFVEVLEDILEDSYADGWRSVDMLYSRAQIHE